jgi:hypothetical protein
MTSPQDDAGRKILTDAISLASVVAEDFDSRTFRRWMGKALIPKDERDLPALSAK